MLTAQFNDKQFQAENDSNRSLILTVVKPASSAIVMNLAVYLHFRHYTTMFSRKQIEHIQFGSEI